MPLAENVVERNAKADKFARGEKRSLLVVAGQHCNDIARSITEVIYVSS